MPAHMASQERWDEMDWDSNGDISFGEFVYAFTKWADFENGDEDTIEGRVRKKKKKIQTRPRKYCWKSALVTVRP